MKTHVNYFKLLRLSKTLELMAVIAVVNPKYAKEQSKLITDLKKVLFTHSIAKKFYNTPDLLKD